MNNGNLVKLVKEFDDIYLENKFWYSITKETLFDIVVKSIKIESLEKFQVMILEKDFRKLYKKYNKRIKTSWSTNRKELSYVFCAEDESVNVEMFLLVPTNINKVNKVHSFRNKLNHVFYMDNKSLSNCWKIIKKCSFFIKPFIHYKNTKDEYNFLVEKKYSGFYTISSPFDEINKNWIPNLSFKTTRFKVGNSQINITKEWKEIMYIQYDVVIVDTK